MSSPQDGPDAFDYDVLADVSHHGASVFDFLSQPNMFGPGASIHSPSMGASPLGHPRSAADHHMTALSLAPSLPTDESMVMRNDGTSAHIASESTLLHDVSMSPSPPPTTALPSSATPRGAKSNANNAALSKKRESTTVGAAGSKPPFSQQSFGNTYPVLNQSESFCTTDSLPVSNSLPVALTISKVDRRGRPSRSDSALPILMDASGDAGGSVSALHSPSTMDDLEPGKDVHNSHTRRCRAKVNNKFQELLRILPTPPPKTGVKHKAQILDYTIRVFREIYAKKLHLEAELALSSRPQLNMWVESVVRPATRLADILNPFMSLICTKEKWQFAETWVPAVPTISNGRKAVDSTSHHTDAPFDASQLVRFYVCSIGSKRVSNNGPLTYMSITFCRDLQRTGTIREVQTISLWEKMSQRKMSLSYRDRLFQMPHCVMEQLLFPGLVILTTPICSLNWSGLEIAVALMCASRE